MKAAFETLDGLRDVKDCPDVDDGATTIMAPIWRGYPTVIDPVPKGFMAYRKYERTPETHAGCPLFREVRE